MITMILLGASIFGYFFTLSHVTQDLVAYVGALPVSRWIIIALLLAGYIVLGSFMDQIAILVLAVPIVLPLIKSLGFDPIWFGVIKIVTAEVGMITPPVGLNCFIVARYAGRPAENVIVVLADKGFHETLSLTGRLRPQHRIHRQSRDADDDALAFRLALTQPNVGERRIGKHAIRY